MVLISGLWYAKLDLNQKVWWFWTFRSRIFCSFFLSLSERLQQSSFFWSQDFYKNLFTLFPRIVSALWQFFYFLNWIVAAETIQGRKLFAATRYSGKNFNVLFCLSIKIKDIERTSSVITPILSKLVYLCISYVFDKIFSFNTLSFLWNLVLVF